MCGLELRCVLLMLMSVAMLTAVPSPSFNVSLPDDDVISRWKCESLIYKDGIDICGDMSSVDTQVLAELDRLSCNIHVPAFCGDDEIRGRCRGIAMASDLIPCMSWGKADESERREWLALQCDEYLETPCSQSGRALVEPECASLLGFGLFCANALGFYLPEISIAHQPRWSELQCEQVLLGVTDCASFLGGDASAVDAFNWKQLRLSVHMCSVNALYRFEGSRTFCNKAGSQLVLRARVASPLPPLIDQPSLTKERLMQLQAWQHRSTDSQCSMHGYRVTGVSPYCDCHHGWSGDSCEVGADSSRESAPVRGAVVYLMYVHHSETSKEKLHGMFTTTVTGVEAVERHLLSRFQRYPVIVFASPQYFVHVMPSTNQTYAEAMVATFPELMINVVEIDIPYPPSVADDYTARPPGCPGDHCRVDPDCRRLSGGRSAKVGVGYMLTQRWRSLLLFEHAALDEYEYILSIDCDLWLTVDFPCDPFVSMASKSKAVFGYLYHEPDSNPPPRDRCNPGIVAHGQQYAAKNNFTPVHLDMIDEHTNYFGNFLLFKLSFFRSDSYLSYARAVDETALMFTHTLWEQWFFPTALGLLVSASALHQFAPLSPFIHHHHDVIWGPLETDGSRMLAKDEFCPSDVVCLESGDCAQIVGRSSVGADGTLDVVAELVHPTDGESVIEIAYFTPISFRIGVGLAVAGSLISVSIGSHRLWTGHIGESRVFGTRDVVVWCNRDVFESVLTSSDRGTLKVAFRGSGPKGSLLFETFKELAVSLKPGTGVMIWSTGANIGNYLVEFAGRLAGCLMSSASTCHIQSFFPEEASVTMVGVSRIFNVSDWNDVRVTLHRGGYSWNAAEVHSLWEARQSWSLGVVAPALRWALPAVDLHDSIVIHFRCSEIPFVRLTNYNLMRYEYYLHALNVSRVSQADTIYILFCPQWMHGCEASDKCRDRNAHARVCQVYAEDLRSFLLSKGFRNVVLRCRGSDEDFAFLRGSRSLISSGSTFSLMAALTAYESKQQSFFPRPEKVDSRLWDEFVVNSPTFVDPEKFMLPHSDVVDYFQTLPVLAQLRPTSYCKNFLSLQWDMDIVACRNRCLSLDECGSYSITSLQWNAKHALNHLLRFGCKINPRQCSTEVHTEWITLPRPTSELLD